jgi:transcriptional regulator with XRE-family HTH domain
LVFFGNYFRYNCEGYAIDGEVVLKIDHSEIGKRIRARREYLRITQDDMAKRFSMSRANWSRIESGNVGVMAADLAEIADALKVDITYFYENDAFEEIAGDGDVMLYYNGMPPILRPAAKAALKALYEQQDREDAVTTVGKKAE